MAFPTTPTAAVQGAKEPCAQVPNRHRGSAYMNDENRLKPTVIQSSDQKARGQS